MINAYILKRTHKKRVRTLEHPGPVKLHTASCGSRLDPNICPEAALM